MSKTEILEELPKFTKRSAKKSGWDWLNSTAKVDSTTMNRYSTRKSAA